VTIQDLIAPVAKCKNATAFLDANGAIIVPPSTVDNGSTDNCSFTLSLKPTSFTCANLGANTVTLKATDGSGNTNTCTAILTVKDAMPPTAICKNPTIFLNSTGHATLTVADVDNNSTDNCSILSRTLSATMFNCGDLGTQNVFLTLMDGSGNTSSCTASVLVKDNIAPTAICQNTTVTLGTNGTAVVYGATLAATSVDNCAVWSYAPVAKVYTSANLGTNNLLITVKDFSNNAATCTSVVTVLPNGPVPILGPKPVNLNIPKTVNAAGHDDKQGIESEWAENQPSRTLAEDAGIKILIYPNPTAGAATLEFELPEIQDFQLNVYDFTGRLMLHRETQGIKGENSMLIELGSMPPGLYLVEFRSGQFKSLNRLVVGR
jgi:hypothetical protein